MMLMYTKILYYHQESQLEHVEATIASQAETIRQLQEEQVRVRARKQAAKNERY